jgi:Nickel responsive protein SCO4226-like
MPRFLIIRSFDVQEDQMPFIGRRSRVLTEEDFPEITWEHSHVVVGDDGFVRTYCVYEAPDEDTVRRHATQLGEHTIDVIYEIAGDASPDDYPNV